MCALLVSAFAAQGASAATGTTGTAPAGTEYTGSITGFASLNTFFHSVISGVEVEFRSAGFSGTGSMESMVAGTGEHTSNGTGTAEFKSVTVVKPAGKGCNVKTGKVVTNTLKATTAGQGMGLRFEPNAATPLAKFEVEGCSIAPLNGVYEVTGSVVGQPAGTEFFFARENTTGLSTLKLRGQNAGIAGLFGLQTSGLAGRSTPQPSKHRNAAAGESGCNWHSLTLCSRSSFGPPRDR